MSRGETTVLAKLFVGVEAICAPVLIIGASGDVLHANAKGRSLFERDAQLIAQSIRRTLAGEPHDGCVLIPLVDQNESVQYLAILDSGAAVAEAIAPVVSVDAASARWKLTARQVEVLDLVARGMTNATIATILEIGVATVEFHVSRILNKAGVENRASLIAKLLRRAV
jgi:DNA-binding NarL/FixJ family response regulator